MPEHRTDLPYGPHTAAIRRFLVRLAGLGSADRALVVERYAVQVHSTAYQAAEAALAVAIERSGRDAARDALSGPLMQLVRRPVTAAEQDVPTPDEDDPLSGLDPVAEPALAALLALLVADLLETPQLEALYDAFHDTIPRADVLPARH
jgi:hypothetical protein